MRRQVVGGRVAEVDADRRRGRGASMIGRGRCSTSANASSHVASTWTPSRLISGVRRRSGSSWSCLSVEPFGQMKPVAEHVVAVAADALHRSTVVAVRTVISSPHAASHSGQVRKAVRVLGSRGGHRPCRRHRRRTHAPGNHGTGRAAVTHGAVPACAMHDCSPTPSAGRRSTRRTAAPLGMPTGPTVGRPRAWWRASTARRSSTARRPALGERQRLGGARSTPRVADVIIVGAGTVRAEGYGPPEQAGPAHRRRHRIRPASTSTPAVHVGRAASSSRPTTAD